MGSLTCNASRSFGESDSGMTNLVVCYVEVQLASGRPVSTSRLAIGIDQWEPEPAEQQAGRRTCGLYCRFPTSTVFLFCEYCASLVPLGAGIGDGDGGQGIRRNGVFGFDERGLYLARLGGRMSAIAKVADLRKILAPPERLSAFFHMVNRILPDGQVVLSIPPETPARDALALMRQHGYSQLPVRQGDSVLGLFTYRAFALEVAKVADSRVDAASLTVEEFLEHEKPAFARLNDEFRSLIDVLDERDSVVVSGPEDLVAILTPMDVLRYLYSVANAFVLIEEIELALRALIRSAIGDDKVFRACVENALSAKYEGRERPRRLEDMTFDEYLALLRDGRNWKHFEKTFGGTRDRTRARLEPVRDLRNDVFHFRRELSVEDHERLTTCRDWLLRCVRKVQARRGGQR